MSDIFVKLIILITNLEEINIPFLDMHEEVFLYEEDPLNLFPFKLSGHYNMEGYKKISTSIFKLTN